MGSFALPFIDIGPYHIEYSVSRGTSTRYTYFRFRSDLKLEVVIPRGRSVDISSLLKRREAWIRKHYEQLVLNTTIFDGRSIMYDGKHLLILFEKTEEREELVPDTDAGTVVIRAIDKARILELIRRWFVRETSRYVVRKLAALSEANMTKYRRADVRQMKNWGYCTKDGRLSFSWQLIALPEPLREYVVMHELSHLKEFNHSMKFKKELAKLCPDYRVREKALDKIVPGRLSDYLP